MPEVNPARAAIIAAPKNCDDAVDYP